MSVAFVEKKTLRLDLPPEGFRLDGGGVLKRIDVAYEAFGERRGDNVVYICHALTGDSHVAGKYRPEDKKEGWWDWIVGPGRAIDTNRFHVICANILGGCSGTTGPSSINPDTGAEYGASFPQITIQDMTRVQHALLAQLGIDHLYACVGGSLGALNVLQFAVTFPGFVGRALCIAGTANLSAMNLAFDIIGRDLILRDPAWQGGSYYRSESKPHNGLSAARMLAHVTYLSKQSMEEKFGRLERLPAQASGQDAPGSRGERTSRPSVPSGEADSFRTAFQVESYLSHQGEAFIGRFDANSYLYITKAMDEFDIVEHHEPAHAVFEPTTADFLVVALSSDWLFPPEESKEIAGLLLRAGKRVSYCEIDSAFGHDAFLIPNDQLFRVIESFLSEPPPVDPASTASNSKGPRSPLDREAEKVLRTLLPRAGSLVDLGCGQGSLLAKQAVRPGTRVQGVDIDFESVVSLAKKRLPIFQTDLDMGLSMIPVGFYDAAVLSSTLQTVRKPDLVIEEMLRVAREGIVSFPNLGHWRNRLSVVLSGRMPRGASLESEWYDTPNIHFLSLDDFRRFCGSRGIRIMRAEGIGLGFFSRILLRLGFTNLGAEKVVVKIRREPEEERTP